jgi:hypothetical protein
VKVFVRKHHNQEEETTRRFHFPIRNTARAGEQCMESPRARRLGIHLIAILAGIIAGYSFTFGVIANPLFGFVVAVAVAFVVDYILCNSVFESR